MREKAQVSAHFDAHLPESSLASRMAQRRETANRRQLTLLVFVGEMSTDLSIV